MNGVNGSSSTRPCFNSRSNDSKADSKADSQSFELTNLDGALVHDRVPVCFYLKILKSMLLLILP